jgi:tripartite-type tricarboxylate transporter receptor subunit TctC
LVHTDGGRAVEDNCKDKHCARSVKSSAPAIVDAIGDMEMLFAGILSLISQTKAAGWPLATSSTQRLAMISDVPTFIESGFPEMTTSVWFD